MLIYWLFRRFLGIASMDLEEEMSHLGSRFIYIIVPPMPPQSASQFRKIHAGIQLHY